MIINTKINPKINPEYQIFKLSFDSWCLNNHIQDKKTNITSYLPKNTIFMTSQDWRIATKDNYYKEINIDKKIDIEELENMAEQLWFEEIGKDGLVELNYNPSDIYEESSSVFNRCLNKVIQQMEDVEYEV